MGSKLYRHVFVMTRFVQLHPDYFVSMCSVWIFLILPLCISTLIFFFFFFFFFLKYDYDMLTLDSFPIQCLWKAMLRDCALSWFTSFLSYKPNHMGSNIPVLSCQRQNRSHIGAYVGYALLYTRQLTRDVAIYVTAHTRRCYIRDSSHATLLYTRQLTRDVAIYKTAHTWRCYIRDSSHATFMSRRSK